MLEPEFRSRLAAEFCGTLLLVALVTGTATGLLSAEASRLSTLQGPPGSQGRFFESLLINSSADLVTVALVALVALAILLPAFGRISGAHFNPAVTFALAVTRRFPWIEVAPYIVAQFLGGIAGAFLVAAIYGRDGASIWVVDVLFGAPVLAEGVAQYQALAAEATGGLLVMVAVVSVQWRIHERVTSPVAGIVVGLAYAGAILIAGPITGGSANPARSLGPLVASLPFDVGSIPWSYLVVYLVGPLAGAMLAALVLDVIAGRRLPRREQPPETDEEEQPYFVVGTTDRE